MKSFALPFTIDVELKTYQHLAFPLGIIKLNIRDYDIWICNKFIQCNTMFGGPMLSYSGEWLYTEELTETQSISVYPEMFSKECTHLIPLCKEMLMRECYVLGVYDEFFIKGKSAYNRARFAHDFVIYGFDDEKQVFKSAGYLQDNQYQMFDINYEDFYQGVTKNLMKECRLFFCHIKKGYASEINIPLIKEELNDYINSKSTRFPHRRDALFGLAVWENLLIYDDQIAKQNLDLRYSRLYTEHKSLMDQRMKMLIQLDYLNDTDLCKKYYEDVVVKSGIVHSLYIKYNLTKDRTIVERLGPIIKDINTVEKDYLSKLRNLL